MPYRKTFSFSVASALVVKVRPLAVFQETCIKVLGNISSFRGDGSLLTWLYRVATNEALQHLRRQAHLFQSIDSLGDTLAERLKAEAMLHENEAVII